MASGDESVKRGFSRRSLLKGAAATPCTVVGAAGAADRTIIRVSAPAGPAPAGAAVETAIPFRRGRLTWPAALSILSPEGKPVLAQLRPSSRWPDSSVRWLFAVFQADAGPGEYLLTEGSGPAAADLVIEGAGVVWLDSGAIRIDLDREGRVGAITVPGRDGSPVALVHKCDLVITHRNGAVFRSSAAVSPRLTVEDRGPVSATVRAEGRCRSESSTELLDYILRWTVYRNRPEALLNITWINTTANVAEQIRDIRLQLPFSWAPERTVFGCERGVFDGPFLKDWPLWILQEDHGRYWARTQNPDGRIQNLSSGGANGGRCPGWLYLAGAARLLGVQVCDFHEKFPNEIAVRDGELSIGLWPERANAHLKTGTLLPANPFGTPYRMSQYRPVLPHPYTAFVAPEDGCLDVPQGVAMTQTIVLGAWAGQAGEPLFETKIRSNALRPVRGVVDPESASAALGLTPRRKDQHARIEQMFDENFGWLDRHIDLQKCYGKFDYGDFRYFTAATDYLSGPGTKWEEMGEMPREGYWHNNERDALRGLILYYIRTGDSAAWKRCEIAARHALDVDNRHSPQWGMWTHSYGHCYLALGEGGEPDHSWLLGLLDWAGISGDPVAAAWVRNCGERLAGLKIDFEQADARTAAVFVHMMCQFYLHTGARSYLEAARPAVAAFRKLQNPNGSWPAYLGNLKQPRIEGFVEHVVMALADYYAIERDPELLKVIDRALVYLFGEKGNGDVDPGESGFAVYALATMCDTTGDLKYARTARAVLEKLRDHLNLSPDPYCRGDLWAGWGPNRTSTPGSSGRPPQMLSQTRPLSPSTLLAYAQPAMTALARLGDE